MPSQSVLDKHCSAKSGRAFSEPCPLTEQMGGNNFCFTGFMVLMRAAGLLRKKAAGLKVRRDIHRAGGATDSHDK